MKGETEPWRNDRKAVMEMNLAEKRYGLYSNTGQGS